MPPITVHRRVYHQFCVCRRFGCYSPPPHQVFCDCSRFGYHSPPPSEVFCVCGLFCYSPPPHEVDETTPHCLPTRLQRLFGLRSAESPTDPREEDKQLLSCKRIKETV